MWVSCKCFFRGCCSSSQGCVCRHAGITKLLHRRVWPRVAVTWCQLRVQVVCQAVLGFRSASSPHCGSARLAYLLRHARKSSEAPCFHGVGTAHEQKTHAPVACSTKCRRGHALSRSPALPSASCVAPPRQAHRQPRRGQHRGAAEAQGAHRQRAAPAPEDCVRHRCAEPSCACCVVDSMFPGFRWNGCGRRLLVGWRSSKSALLLSEFGADVVDAGQTRLGSAEFGSNLTAVHLRSCCACHTAHACA